jgi:hypothetical protein
MADPIQILRTRENLKRVRGGRDGLYPHLENATWDVVKYFDDFLGDEMRGSGAVPGAYEIITGVDGTFSILANQENGVGELAASTGAGSSGEYCGLSLPELSFTGERNAIIAVRTKVDAITTVKMEIGFTDVTTDAGAVNSLSGASATAANAVVWVFDTSDTAYWQGFGVQATTVATKIEPSIAPVAATYETMVVALRDTNAKFLRLSASGGLTYESEWMTSAVTAATPLVPWVFVQLRGSADRNMSIDFIDVRARRTT